MSPPVGPTGLPQSCDGTPAAEAHWRSGLAAGAFSTEIEFPDERVALEEVAVQASLGWHPTPRWGVAIAAGAIADGTITRADGTRHDVRPGFAASLSGSWLALTESRVRPFVSVGLSLAISRTHTEGGAGLTAGDLRASVLAGKTFFDALVPYVVLRGFGGPVVWDRVSEAGGDANHYAIGIGATVRLPLGLDVFVEGLPLGEQSLSAGAGLSF